ncbi:MAG: hypothetical protein JNJ54_10530 [Myxococcaceae bacterium]|nr:hypothetical protein [Myxococcaceae bacterium]
MDRLSVMAMLMLASCAHETAVHREMVAPGVRSFAGLRGRTVSVILVDLDGRFDASSSSPRAARAAIIETLRGSDVTVVDEATHRLIFELHAAGPPVASTQQCLRISGRLEVTAQAFLPSQSAEATRCGGRGPGSDNRDVVGGLLSAGAQAIRAASDGPERDLTEALFWALDDVLTQLDLVVRF